MTFRRCVLGGVLFSVAAIAAAAAASAQDTAAVTPRTELGAQALVTARTAGPWSMAAFAPPPARAGDPATRNVFEGRLRILGERPEHGFKVLLDRYGDATANDGAARHLPALDAEFVQAGGALIPVRRGALPADHPEWEFILEPGRVWDEPGDGGYTRAALPFTLEERNANCMHQGVLTFLFHGDGKVSDVAFEIGHETCAYFQFDWWGYAQAAYTPQPVGAHSDVVARYAEEVALRLPVRGIAEVARDFPGAQPQKFGSALELPPASLSTYGLVVDGVRYAGECGTRFGQYPFCEVMDLPSYSLAKSIVGGIASLRLAALYPQLMHTQIADLVPECAGAGGWQGVTVENTLDMATGRYRSAEDEHDEDAADMSAFFLAERHAQRLEFGCRHYPRRSAPGTRWVYHTADTYVLGTALNAFYRARTSPEADFYRDVLAKDLWPALHLGPTLQVPRRTYDGVRQVFTGYGLTLHADDVAKLAAFLNGAHGRIGERQVLDGALLDEALQRDASHPGLRAGAADLRYEHGFWAWNAASALGCRAPTWIPFMSGYGGIIVAMFPNGMNYYYFSDGGVHRWALAAAEADRLRPFCRR
jgi:hypothetical protein